MVIPLTPVYLGFDDALFINMKKGRRCYGICFKCYILVHGKHKCILEPSERATIITSVAKGSSAKENK